MGSVVFKIKQGEYHCQQYYFDNNWSDTLCESVNYTTVTERTHHRPAYKMENSITQLLIFSLVKIRYNIFHVQQIMINYSLYLGLWQNILKAENLSAK